MKANLFNNIGVYEILSIIFWITLVPWGDIQISAKLLFIELRKEFKLSKLIISRKDCKK